MSMNSNASAPDLFKPIRLLMEGRRIFRTAETPPGKWPLLRSWLNLQMAGSAARQAAPFVNRVGPLEIAAHNYDDGLALFEEIFLSRIYETRLGRHDPFILDCGGNVGFATLYFKLHYPAARVITFEPNPSCFSLLKRNIESNGLRNVTLVNAACGREGGEVSFFVNPQHSMAGSAQMKWSEDSTRCTVKQVRLSEFIDREVDLLKLDVEGAEWEVIEDLIASGRIKSVKRMIIEYHHRMDSLTAKLGRFLRLLEDAGMTYDLMASVPPGKRFGDKWQAVMIFAGWPQDVPVGPRGEN